MLIYCYWDETFVHGNVQLTTCFQRAMWLYMVIRLDLFVYKY